MAGTPAPKGSLARAVIFANGSLQHLREAAALVRPDDLLIAADGGLHHLQALGLTPHVLIGDFDSLDPESLPALAQAGVEFVQHPSRKDATDLELAVDYARARGITQALILGAVGGRWDQSLANLLLAAGRELAGLRIRLVDGPQEAQLVSAGETLELRGQAGDTVSLIPIGGDAGGVTTSGLEYPLDNQDLPFGTSLGISNILLGERGRVSLETGSLMCILIHGPVAQVE